MITASLASVLQRFFTERLLGQLGASPHTVASYRDTFRLLLRFLSERLKRVPSEIRLEELDAFVLGRFLENLETQRRNSIRTRNTRLSALRAFFRFVSLSEPALALQCQRVLAMPAKRYERGPVEFLDEGEAAQGFSKVCRWAAEHGKRLAGPGSHAPDRTGNAFERRTAQQRCA
jgi:site-specific recombinase XerD